MTWLITIIGDGSFVKLLDGTSTSQPQANPSQPLHDLKGGEWENMGRDVLSENVSSPPHHHGYKTLTPLARLPIAAAILTETLNPFSY